jgi:hypothetical protein
MLAGIGFVLAAWAHSAGSATPAKARDAAATSCTLDSGSTSTSESYTCPVLSGSSATQVATEPLQVTIQGTTVSFAVTGTEPDSPNQIGYELDNGSFCFSSTPFTSKVSSCSGPDMAEFPATGPAGDFGQGWGGQGTLPASLVSAATSGTIYLQMYIPTANCQSSGGPPTCTSIAYSTEGWQCGPVVGCADYFGNQPITLPGSTPLPVSSGVGIAGATGLVAVLFLGAQLRSSRKRRLRATG